MQRITGHLTLEHLADAADCGEIDTVLVGFTDLYGRLVGKRFDIDYFLQHVAARGTHACDYLLTVDMEMDPTPGYRLANWGLCEWPIGWTGRRLCCVIWRTRSPARP
jgi:glutamine synthetase